MCKEKLRKAALIAKGLAGYFVHRMYTMYKGYHR